MKKNEKLLNYLYLNKEDEIILYDKKESRIFIYDEEWSKEHETVIIHYTYNDSIDEMPIKDFAEIANNLIPFPKPNNIEIMKDFARKYSYPDLLDCLYKKGAYRNFKNLLKKYSLLDSYYAFEDKCYKKIITDWEIQFGIKEKKITKKERTNLVKLSNEAFSYHPWEYFTDEDYFTIRYLNMEISYIVLGYYGNCYGICIYFGKEGKRELQLESIIASLDEESLLPMAIKNSYAIYFDPYDTLTPEDKDFLDGTIGKIEDISYPSFNVFTIGRPVTPAKNSLHYKNISVALSLFNTFMEKYIEKPINSKQVFHLDITIDDNDNVKYKKTKEEESPIPYFDLSLLENENEYKKCNSTYVLDITVSPGPVVKNGESYLPFIPILYDLNKDIIAFAAPTIAECDDYVSAIYHELDSYFKSTRAPKEILATNPIASLLGVLLLKDKDRVSITQKKYEALEEFKQGLLDQLVPERKDTIIQ